jgi:2-oxoglutarate ferredoxin oxidoreductase subunit beta
MAPTSLLGMKTTTTPYGRQAVEQGYPFHGAELAASIKGVSYSARVSVHTPAHYQKAKKAVKIAFEKQLAGAGYSLVEILGTCPTNWQLDPLQSLEFIEMEMTKEFPLGEFKNGAAG